MPVTGPQNKKRQPRRITQRRRTKIVIFSGTMTRKAKGHPVTADYTVWTVELNREELMIILNGIRNHRINRAKLTLQNMRARRDRGSKQTKHVKNNTR